MKAERWSVRLQLALLPRIAAVLIRFLHRCIRPEVLGEDEVLRRWQQGERLLLPFWHDQLLLMVRAYRGPGAKVLISASRDGELIARTMNCFGLGTVRGSSRRGGREAFRALVQLGKEPFDLAITPDGPKGPRHELKDGIVELARITGRTVVPMCFVCSRGWRLPSWDRFLIPSPFARGVYSYGEPVTYRDGEGSEAFRVRLHQSIRANQERAEAHLRSYGLSPL